MSSQVASIRYNRLCKEHRRFLVETKDDKLYCRGGESGGHFVEEWAIVDRRGVDKVMLANRDDGHTEDRDTLPAPPVATVPETAPALPAPRTCRFCRSAEHDARRCPQRSEQLQKIRSLAKGVPPPKPEPKAPKPPELATGHVTRLDLASGQVVVMLPDRMTKDEALRVRAILKGVSQLVDAMIDGK